MIPALALLLTGCAPNDAEVTGTWHVWLAANNSGTVDEANIDVVDRAKRIYECSGRGWDSDTDDWEDGYIGPLADDDASSDKFFGGACEPGDGDCPAADLSADCDLVDAMEYYDFLQRDGFYYLTEPIDAWRSEALINGEGDFQVTIHNKLGNGQDLRFMFSIKPDFAPTICDDEDGDGTAEVIYEDGSRWIDAWSDGLGGDQIYYLNAGAQQSSPGDFDDYGDPYIWYFPTEWAAGFGHAKFAAEEFTSRPNQYGLYDEEGFGQHFELGGGIANEDPDAGSQNDTYWGQVIVRENPDMTAYAETAAELQALADGWAAEFDGVAINGVDPAQADLSSFSHKVEDNSWRPVDLTVPGIDGWMEVAASWVRIKSGSELVEGGAAEGEFQIYFEGFESASVMVVEGSFVIDKIRKDKWSYPNLEEEKREENGTTYCEEETATE